MRSVFVAWLRAHGLPGFLIPDYATMCGVAAILGAVVALRLAERDGEKLHVQARAMLIAYLAALLGGYVFEWIRAVPDAIAARSIDPFLESGRAAYGGLLASIVAPSLYLRRWARREGIDGESSPVRAFLDRATPGLGIAFALVRVGCFLEGCDYGKPTAGPFGVRFPVGSLAAQDHFARGFVAEHATSLPVHPTELYESAVGIVASLLAWRWLRARCPERAGAAFLVWLFTYASGRFAIEMLRGDAERGIYLGLSTAQIVSLALVGASLALAHRWRLPVLGRSPLPLAAAALVGLVLTLAPRSARAQAAPPAPAAAAPDAVVLQSGERVTGTIVESVPGDHVSVRTSSGQVSFIAWVFVASLERGGVVEVVSSPAPSGAASPPASSSSSSPYVTLSPGSGEPATAQVAASPGPDRASADLPTSDHSVQRDRHVSARVTVASSLVLARPDVPSGFVTAVDALYRVRLGGRSRLDVGLEGRVSANAVAYHYGMGLPVELVQEIGRHFELRALFVPTHTWIDFDSPAFSSTNVWAVRLGAEATWVVSSRVSFGVSPLAFNVLSSVNVGVITTYEPHLTFGLAF